MILVPIGQEHEVRRMPWISASLFLVLVFVFMVSGFGLERTEQWERVAERALTINEFLVDHPYLEPPRELQVFFGSDYLEERRTVVARLPGQLPPEAEINANRQALSELRDALVVATHRLPSYEWGFIPVHPELLTFITSMFLHANWQHLLGNLLFLFAVGPYLEDIYGRVVFAPLYFLSGSAATLAHTLRFPDSPIPLIGASGAIAGVMGAFLVRLAATRIKFFLMPIPILWFIRVTFLAPAFIVLPIWFAGQLVALGSAASSGVAIWGHVGGFCFGAVFAGILRVTRLDKRLAPAIIAVPTAARTDGPRSISDKARIQAARTGAITRSDATVRVSGPTARQTRSVAAAPAIEGKDVVSLTAALERAAAAGHHQEVMWIAERLLSILEESGDVPGAFAHLRDIRKRFRGSITAKFGLVGGEFYTRQGDEDLALGLFAETARRFPADPDTLRALTKAAEIYRGRGAYLDAVAVLEVALLHPSCTPEWAAFIDKGLRDAKTAAKICS